MTSRVLSHEGMIELVIGRGLVLDIFQVWRRDLAFVDALILLVIATGNVDGILFNRELRSRYGGEAPIAPDSLRQPIGTHAIAVTLGLSDGRVRQRVTALAQRGECAIGPEGMIITEQQLEAANRTAIVHAVYGLLAGAYARLRALDAAHLAELPLENAPRAPVRSASAFAAKYVLRTLEAFAELAGGVVGAMILLELLRRTAMDPAEAASGGALEGPNGKTDAVGASELAATLGVSRQRAQAEVRSLVSRGLCERRGRRAAAAWTAVPPPRLVRLAQRNHENLYQLLAGLAEVGALAEFERS